MSRTTHLVLRYLASQGVSDQKFLEFREPPRLKDSGVNLYGNENR